MRRTWVEADAGHGTGLAVQHLEPRVLHAVLAAHLLHKQLGIRVDDEVAVLVGDGTLGWRPFAPYDAILVAAASPSVPAPLVEQLAPGGRLVIPIGDRDSQVLQLLQKDGDRIVTTSLGDVRFVPLLG